MTSECTNDNNCLYGDSCEGGYCLAGGKLQYFKSPEYDYAVLGSNNVVLDNIYTAAECADRCHTQNSFYCASFEYAPAGARCVLSEAVYPVVYAAGWNLYFRK